MLRKSINIWLENEGFLCVTSKSTFHTEEQKDQQDRGESEAWQSVKSVLSSTYVKQKIDFT